MSIDYSRRDFARGALGLGGLIALDALLQGCGGACEVRFDGVPPVPGGFLAAYGALTAQHPLDPVGLVKARAALLAQWVAKEPVRLFDELRDNHPVLSVLHTADCLAPSLAICILDRDVRQVLTTNDVFTVAPNTPEMVAACGGFALGDTNLTSHDHDKRILTSVVRPDDAARVREICRRNAERIVNEVRQRGDGTLDVQKDVASVICVNVIDEYFGVPSGRNVPAGLTADAAEAEIFQVAVGAEIRPTEAQIYKWVCDAFQNFFLNLAGDATVRERGRAASKKLLTYIAKIVQHRKGEMRDGQPAPNDMIGRCLWHLKDAPDAGFTEDRIAPNVFGTVAGAAANMSELIVNAFDVLVDPRYAGALAGAEQAAKAGDDAALLGYFLEAGRLKPQADVLVRLVAKDTTLGGVKLPQGTLLMVAIGAAMREPAVVPRPNEFIVDPNLRPRSVYLTFGHGRYECLGRYVAPLEGAESFRAVLRAGKLARLPGDGSAIRYEGPFATQFKLAFT